MAKFNGITAVYVFIFCVLPIIKVLFLSIFLWDVLGKLGRK